MQPIQVYLTQLNTTVRVDSTREAVSYVANLYPSVKAGDWVFLNGMFTQAVVSGGELVAMVACGVPGRYDG